MHYLIDGHNLIARVPGLSLADPDDEVKLLQLLKRWAAARRLMPMPGKATVTSSSSPLSLLSMTVPSPNFAWRTFWPVL